VAAASDRITMLAAIPPVQGATLLSNGIHTDQLLWQVGNPLITSRGTVGEKPDNPAWHGGCTEVWHGAQPRSPPSITPTFTTGWVTARPLSRGCV
jgi:hypothetical protein